MWINSVQNHRIDMTDTTTNSMNNTNADTNSTRSENKTKIKTPCCAVLGHVDVGKTKLLDYMRHTETEEASGITQQIGTTLYSRDRLEKLVGENLKGKFKLDSMLMIDTPGHECFDMIRSVALRVTDVVILLVDMVKGLEKQTVNVISMLIKYKVPFIICINKMDRIYGWKQPVKGDNLNIASVLKRMTSETRTKYQDYVQQIQYKLYEYDVSSELYYQNKSPDDMVSMVPISAKTGEGIPDLIMLISMMAEKRYLADKLIEQDITHGYVLDSHYDKHHGQYHIVLHRNGQLTKGDILVINGHRYYVKHILANSDNKEIKDDHRFLRIDSVERSIGLGIVLDPLDEQHANDSIEPASMYILDHQVKDVDVSSLPLAKNSKSDYEERWGSYLCEKGDPGITVIAPSHIMMDGLLHMIKNRSSDQDQTHETQHKDESNPVAQPDHKQDKSGKKGKKRQEPIPQIVAKDPTENTHKSKDPAVRVERYKIGKIDKKDLIICNRWNDKEKIAENKLFMKRYSVILSYDPATEALSREIMDLAESYKVTIIHSDVVYKLLEAYDKFVKELDEQIIVLKNEPKSILALIPKYIFRSSDPMIFGVMVNHGSVKIGDKLYSDQGMNILIGKIESIQKDKLDVDHADSGQEVCIKISTKKVIGKDVLPDGMLFSG